LFNILSVGTIASVPLVFHRTLKPLSDFAAIQAQKALSNTVCMASYRLLFGGIFEKEAAG
jgi:hypothetical protein